MTEDNIHDEWIYGEICTKAVIYFCHPKRVADLYWKWGNLAVQISPQVFAFIDGSETQTQYVTDFIFHQSIAAFGVRGK